MKSQLYYFWNSLPLFLECHLEGVLLSFTTWSTVFVSFTLNPLNGFYFLYSLSEDIEQICSPGHTLSLVNASISCLLHIGSDRYSTIHNLDPPMIIVTSKLFCFSPDTFSVACWDQCLMSYTLLYTCSWLLSATPLTQSISKLSVHYIVCHIWWHWSHFPFSGIKDFKPNLQGDVTPA